MSNLSQFGGGGIKSIQRGVITFTPVSGLASGTATITAVNTAKSMITLQGARYSGNQFTDLYARVDLTNSTTVTAVASGAGAPVEVGWQVIEFL